jgi:hypothetical protein
MPLGCIIKAQPAKGMEMEDYQQRVMQEKAELDRKAKALSEFIGNNPAFDAIDPDEQERMKVQNDIMRQYSEVLGERIASFK